MQNYLDTAEHCLLGIAGSPECFESLLILSGQGIAPEQLQRGAASVSRFLAQVATDYFERCAQTGLTDRNQRSRLPYYLKQLGV